LRKRDEEEEKETIVLLKKRYNAFSLYLSLRQFQGRMPYFFDPSFS